MTQQGGSSVCCDSDNIQVSQVARNSGQLLVPQLNSIPEPKEGFPQCKSKNENFRSEVFVAFSPAVVCNLERKTQTRELGLVISPASAGGWTPGLEEAGKTHLGI